jgi:hypothetical protein
MKPPSTTGVGLGAGRTKSLVIYLPGSFILISKSLYHFQILG